MAVQKLNASLTKKTMESGMIMSIQRNNIIDILTTKDGDHLTVECQKNT